MELTHETQALLLESMLDLGQLLLDCGAEISRVEDTLARIGRAYGAEETEVFVITSFISLTMEFPGFEAMTETRSIRRDGGTDFTRMEKLNSLSREICASPMPPAALRERIRAIAAGRKPLSTQFIGSALAAGGFAVFFGGSAADGITAAIFGLLICAMQVYLDKTELNTVARNLLISFLIGLVVGVTARVIRPLHMDMILIGDIMLLIPGLAMTNAVRNVLLGDTISGLVRLADSLLWAGALAGGFMVALRVIDMML